MGREGLQAQGSYKEVPKDPLHIPYKVPNLVGKITIEVYTKVVLSLGRVSKLRSYPLL
jgi:hypothetical protein